MQTDNTQLAEDLLLRLLAEDSRARNCLLLAQMWGEDGHSSGASALVAIAQRHVAQSVEVRLQLAALQDQLKHGPALPLEKQLEQPMMDIEEFRERLAKLALGEATLLTMVEFKQVFADKGDLDGMRAAAIELAEQMSCRLLFRPDNAPYAVFTRRQRHSEVRSSTGWRSHV